MLMDMDAKTPKPVRAAPEWMVRDLEISEAEADSGPTVPWEPVLERARQAIARMKAVRAVHVEVAENLSALATEGFFIARANTARRGDFIGFLDAAGDDAPIDGDLLAKE
jgi:hypothetical protein